MCFGTWKFSSVAVAALQLWETEQKSFPLELRNDGKWNTNLVINFSESSTV